MSLTMEERKKIEGMKVGEAREGIVKAKKKADKLSSLIKELKDKLIAHELSKDNTIAKFDVITRDGRVEISQGKERESFRRATKSPFSSKEDIPYAGGRKVIFESLSKEDQDFWLMHSQTDVGHWGITLKK